MGKGTWKRLLLVTVVLLAFTAVMTRFSKEVFVPETVKRQVEVISFTPGSSRVLAAELEEGDSLFFFSLPEGYKEAASWLEIFPQLSDQEAREAFIANFISTITIF